MTHRTEVSGWRGLSLAVGEQLGRPVGVGKVRWAVESSGLRVGRRIGPALIFDRIMEQRRNGFVLVGSLLHGDRGDPLKVRDIRHR